MRRHYQPCRTPVFFLTHYLIQNLKSELQTLSEVQLPQISLSLCNTNISAIIGSLSQQRSLHYKEFQKEFCRFDKLAQRKTLHKTLLFHFCFKFLFHFAKYRRKWRKSRIRIRMYFKVNTHVLTCTWMYDSHV